MPKTNEIVSFALGVAVGMMVGALITVGLISKMADLL